MMTYILSLSRPVGQVHQTLPQIFEARHQLLLIGGIMDSIQVSLNLQYKDFVNRFEFCKYLLILGYAPIANLFSF